MTEHRYTEAERREQMERLRAALEELIPFIAAIPEHARRSADYERALARAGELLASGFAQEDLSELSRSVPELFWLHREWVPPLQRGPGGEWSEPPWFRELDRRLRPVIEAAAVLRQLGYY